MKKLVRALVVTIAAGAAWSGSAFAQEFPPTRHSPREYPPPVQQPPAPPAPPAPAPPPPPAARRIAAGQWVYSDESGWMWVPAGASPSYVDGVPYVYLYTRTHGWTWYVSPWGPSRFYKGAWVHRAWHPRGWRGGWVATPRVTTRLGRRR
jgi:hypothetical protein